MSETNEITSKTSIPLAWAASIVMALLGVVFNAGLAHARFSGLEEKVSIIQVKAAQDGKFARQQQLKVQRIDITLESMNKKLQSIDRKLDRREQK